MSLMKWGDWFYYDETSPTCLRWAVEVVSGRDGNQINCKIGDAAGDVEGVDRLHFLVGLNSKQYLAHRIIYEMFNGPLLAGDFVDHVDGNGKNNRKENLRKVNRSVNMRNCKKRTDNKTGVTGVTCRTTRHGTLQFTASWKELDKRQKSKSFAVEVYGHEEAFRLACEYRAKMIEELNRQGAGYTDDHGVRQ